MELKLTRPLAFVDLETTGINFAKDRIVEIAVLKVMPDGNVHEKQTRVNPLMPIPAQVIAIHGITDEDVKNAPTFEQIAKQYFIFLDECDLAGFNSTRFDFPILLEEFYRAGVIFDVSTRKFVDVQRIYHSMEPRNLGAAYKFYCQKELEGAHGAMADVKATYEVLKSQLDRYPDGLKNDVTFLHDFSKDGDYVDLGKRMYYENSIEMFNFGKHKGKAVTEIFKTEPSYYDWLLKSEFPLDFKEKIKGIKERMKK
ncbi:MAG: 3'-5' exonuclease [Chitinophagales bacterium]